MAQQQPDDDLKQYLQVWPRLVPNPLAMQRTALRMNHRMTALRAAPAELGESQFRTMLTACGTLAVMAYLAWPYISDFLAANPWCYFVLLCVGTFSLIAPLILLPLLRASGGEIILSEPQRGERSC